jgi:hypothetical protein
LNEELAETAATQQAETKTPVDDMLKGDEKEEEEETEKSPSTETETESEDGEGKKARKPGHGQK